MVSRRFFLSGAASFGAVAGCRSLCSGAAFFRPRVKFGVLSDVHVRSAAEKQYSTEHVIRALEYFRDNGADGVLIAGDIADQGHVSQLKYFADAWYAVFPNDTAPDGRHVEKLFVYGNHDYEGWTWGRSEEDRKKPEVLADAIGCSQEAYAKAWEDCFHEKFEPIWIKDVKGYKFVGRHWGYADRLDAFLAAHADELKGSKPFFYTQHDHSRNTVFGSWAWGADDGSSTKTLSKYPNCVAFSGHSHYSLTDERTIWQGAFTAVNTASMRYASSDYNLRDNISHNDWGYKLWQRSRVTPQLDHFEGKQGMLVEVGDTEMRIRRLQFVYGTEPLGEDLIVSLPCPGERPMDYATRKAKRVPPAFAKDAVVAVKQLTDEKGRKVVRVSFPAAKPVDGCRVFEYEVTAVLLEDDVELVACQKRVIAPDFHLPPSQCGRPGECRFTDAELPPEAHLRFEVRPLECFGVKGRPITADYRMLKF